jgi:hypothetical protein
MSYINKHSKHQFTFWCDWLQVNWKQFNWISFSLINVYFEWDKMFNELELEIGLLGFNIRWQYELPKKYQTKEYKKLLKRVKEINEKM